MNFIECLLDTGCCYRRQKYIQWSRPSKMSGIKFTMTGDDLYQVDKMIMSVGGKCFIWEVGETSEKQ